MVAWGSHYNIPLLEIIIDLPIGFPINNINLSSSFTGLLVRIPGLFRVIGVFMIFRVLAAVKNCRNCQHYGAFTVVKYVKKTCKTVHSIPKETCDKVTRFKQQI